MDDPLLRQAQLVNASRLSAIGELAAALSHEINNPLAVIMGRAEMMQELLKSGKSDPVRFEKMLDEIQTTARRIERIVKSMRLLDGSAGHGSKSAVTPLKEIIGTVRDLCGGRFVANGIQLFFPDIPDDLKINCVQSEIAQVLLNLLNNAYDATIKVKSGRVSLEVTSTDSEVEISILDSGPGIPVELRPKLFQPFFSTKNIQYGTGMGLSISRGLIEAHRGQLLFDPTKDETCFIVRLPRANG